MAQVEHNTLVVGKVFWWNQMIQGLTRRLVMFLAVRSHWPACTLFWNNSSPPGGISHHCLFFCGTPWMLPPDQQQMTVLRARDILGCDGCFPDQRQSSIVCLTEQFVYWFFRSKAKHIQTMRAKSKDGRNTWVTYCNSNTRVWLSLHESEPAEKTGTFKRREILSDFIRLLGNRLWRLLHAYRKYSFCRNNSVRFLTLGWKGNERVHLKRISDSARRAEEAKGFVWTSQMVSVSGGLCSGGYTGPQAYCYCCNTFWRPTEVRIHLIRLIEILLQWSESSLCAPPFLEEDSQPQMWWKRSLESPEATGN